MNMLSKIAPRSVLLALALLAGLTFGQSRARAQSQDDVTVAFLYNFARFVEWPADAMAANAPFTIGFIGRPALAQKFTQAVQGKNVGGRDFNVRNIEAGAAAECQLVFVGDAAAADAAIRAAKGKPVLCVGEGDAFLGGGGMIAFSREGSRLVFDVNPGAITGAGLKPGEKLTKSARSVKGG